jgi:hypothetical protein
LFGLLLLTASFRKNVGVFFKTKTDAFSVLLFLHSSFRLTFLNLCAPPPTQAIQGFLAAKGALDSAESTATKNQVMDALHGVTSVRALLCAKLGSGLRNDAPDRAMVMRQK